MQALCLRSGGGHCPPETVDSSAYRSQAAKGQACQGSGGGDADSLCGAALLGAAGSGGLGVARRGSRARPALGRTATSGINAARLNPNCVCAGASEETPVHRLRPCCPAKWQGSPRPSSSPAASLRESRGTQGQAHRRAAFFRKASESQPSLPPVPQQPRAQAPSPAGGHCLQCHSGIRQPLAFTASESPRTPQFWGSTRSFTADGTHTRCRGTGADSAGTSFPEQVAQNDPPGSGSGR